MLDKLKKNSVKIFVFTINILLAAIAVLIIREKDQARLLQNAQKEVPISGNAQNDTLPSFENSVSVENLGSDTSQANIAEPSPADTSASAAAPVPAVSSPVSAAPGAAVPVPTPAPTTKPSNAKTKTS